LSQVREVRGFTSPVKALEELSLLKPDLVFLDIEMPLLNGFELLQKLMPINFGIVFITAYNQYALRAFKFNALDYLVKPVDATELIAAVVRAEKKTRSDVPQLAELQRQLQGEQIKKIAIPGQAGILFVLLDEIVYAEASDNYSRLVLSDGRSLIVSKTLKDVQDVLEESHFLRVHRQYIINLNHVTFFNRNDGILTMSDRTEVSVARSHKDKLIERYRLL
jgi:two-component system LytT family response regulator